MTTIEIKVEKEEFAVFDPAGILVRVSHNGYQWSTIRFSSLSELELLRKRIDEYIAVDEAKGK